MNTTDLLAALDLPSAARVDQRVAKKLLAEHAANTPADRRCLADGLEEIHWRATLKPSNVGVSIFHDATRSYDEIVVIEAVLRAEGLPSKLAALIHRAISYPVVLLLKDDSGGWLSLAHKRASQREAGSVVVDGDVLMAPLEAQNLRGEWGAFLAALSLAVAPQEHFFALYDRWFDLAGAWLVAGVTGRYIVPASASEAAEARAALKEWKRLTGEIERLRKSATRERQVARLVALNLEVKRLEAARDAVRLQLESVE